MTINNTAATQDGLTAGTRHGIIILAASMMPIMAIVSLVPVLPLLMREFASVEGSQFLVPMALTIPALCVALFSPLAGWLSDRLGRKKLLIAALLLYSVFGIIPWFLHDLFQIIAARVALGVMEAIIMTVATTLIGDYFSGEKREKWIALQVAFGSIAAIFLIAIGGGLGEVFGSRGPFLLYLIAIPVALAAAIILFEPKIKSKEVNQAAVAFPYKTVLPLVLTTVGVGIVFYTVIVQLGPILEISGTVSPSVIGLIGALCNVAVGVGTVIFHRYKKHAGTRLLAVGLLIAGLGYVGVGSSESLVVISACSIIVCIGAGMMLPNMANWTMGTLPAEVRGRGMGLWTGAFFLGQFLAPIVAIAVNGTTGALASTMFAYGIIVVAMAVAIWLCLAVLAKGGQQTSGIDS